MFWFYSYQIFMDRLLIQLTVIISQRSIAMTNTNSCYIYKEQITTSAPIYSLRKKNRKDNYSILNNASIIIPQFYLSIFQSNKKLIKEISLNLYNSNKI